ncbi:MAG TPA: hypothetical protein VNG93_01835 [Candidatus Dormibacteraeota bacterium]|nr:hypothetical protein [Candidatus Dormibacteraeota bacterium]
MPRVRFERVESAGELELDVEPIPHDTTFRSYVLGRVIRPLAVTIIIVGY